jgi:hypothetical protein
MTTINIKNGWVKEMIIINEGNLRLGLHTKYGYFFLNYLYMPRCPLEIDIHGEVLLINSKPYKRLYNNYE